MSRRVYLLGVGLALVALALAFTDWALSLRPGITAANIKRIRPGMTVTEVEALLGQRGGRYFPEDPPPAVWVWVGPTRSVWVSTDDADRVVEVTVWQPRKGEVSTLARLRAWLGW
jgi:hypothetical protein